jgi:peptide/nickel transport system substrate-binding protein
MKVLSQTMAALLAGSLLLAACGSAPPTTQNSEATTAPVAEATSAPTNAPPPVPTAVPTTDPSAAISGGTLIVGTPQEPATLNPLLSTSSIEDAISSFVVEGLVEIDADGNYAPVLAEALPTVSDDGLLVTYTLREGVRFANGDALTCADVQFTYEAITSELSQASTSGYSKIESLECPDERTVEVTFAEVYAPYLRLFSYILPQSAGELDALDSWEFNRSPLGTGPWVVQEWNSGDSIVFERNPNFRFEGQPYLDSVILKIVPSREVGLQLLGTGEIGALWDLTEADFPQLQELEAQGVSYAAAVTGENEYLLLNFADPTVDAPADASANPHPILNDLRVRQAIEQAIDKQLIVDTLLYGNVRVGTTVLPTGPFACEVAPSSYDPAAAAALLDEAGWVPGADGIREKDGQRLSLKIQTTAGNKLREDTQQVLVEMLKQIGIEMAIENLPSDVLFAGWDSNGLRKRGNFDVLLYTTGPSIDPDSHLFGNYHSLSIPTADNEGAGSNFSRYNNADVDAAIDEAATTTDLDARKDAYCKAAEQIAQDLPRIPLYERLLITGYRTEVQNFRVSPGPADFTTGSASWWIKP